mmetsp:Transcript_25701/g.48755  ORF Transcript_25701/g.48755 Transcript_25701/m.48755 type:complete len:211 (+) Transcript_25701:221-853(+)|eukprot:CAMPEP_0114249342 /NCGR_PEP_ID=MMETSP0058-20121206/14090_1 /TAXON_ID=36894 /ORGANISM="Pyramimonas parkeae, CCMP726" /LENGTH=210 /DNA_ID=CAMNT_0001362879 /DNA_START=221 /DNA_END=853 /DNA_ORIENTATION=-
MSKMVSISAMRYVGAKLLEASRTTAKAVAANNVSLADVVDFFKKEYEAPVTEVMYMQGNSMAPTFNAKAEPGTIGEKLLLRKFKNPCAKTVFVGDVVALQDPDSDRVLIRRVAAEEEQEMVSSNPEDKAFYLEQGHCWVLADNETLQPNEAVDSRTLGPVKYSDLVGRVMYSSRSEVDHGSVENSEEAMELDAPVLECEFDPDTFCRPEK